MAAVLFNASAAMAAASPEPELLANLRSLSIDDLANVEIYSVSKSAEPLSQAPAAIYVITREDIRRSGATSIPEMLRLAPNLQVARASALSYAISARGFNDITANKLLVLIDGRSVYTPLYSGVFWDSQSVLPEDVERIEVISGPGATLWGSNAVNGVINIITRNSRDTQGGVVSITGGNAESGVGARFGGQLGENATFRIYGMGFYRNSTILANGRNRNDSWTNPQGGFRVDWNKSSDTLTVQGDIFSGAIEQPTTAHATIEGRNLLGRWTHDFSGGSTMRIQTYYDYSSRSIPGGAADSVEVFDLDLQHSFLLGERNSIVWGGGYRVTSDRFRNAPTGAFLDPTSKTLELGNLFVEDSISVTENLTLIAGVKAEANSYTDIAAMPSARLSWKVAETDMVWAAISRAVRTPARFDKDVYQKNVRSSSLAADRISRTRPSRRMSLAIGRNPSRGRRSRSPPITMCMTICAASSFLRPVPSP